MLKAITLLLIIHASVAVGGGDPDAGKSKAIICIGCHATDGNSTNAVYPKLAGQYADYLAKQIRDFKSGARKDDHMTSMVEAIDKSDISDIAAYFSSQKRTQMQLSDSENKQGKQIYLNGIKEKGIPACSSCHGSTTSEAPTLAAQHADYVTKALKDFREGVRSNDPDKKMRKIAVKLSDQEISTVSSYVAGIPPKD